ncbi:MAG TPA: protein YgfX [Burkholderiales bacterium]|nr:protein YgfX [Burkholderiales bacterium]
MSPILKLDCKVSAALSAAVLLVHSIALFCVWISLPWPAALLTSAGLVLSGWAHWNSIRHKALRRIEWRADGLSLATTDHAVQKLAYEGGAAPGPYWALLRVRSGSGRIRQFFISADALDPPAFRKLRVWLRWHPSDEALKGK